MQNKIASLQTELNAAKSPKPTTTTNGAEPTELTTLKKELEDIKKNMQKKTSESQQVLIYHYVIQNYSNFHYFRFYTPTSLIFRDVFSIAVLSTASLLQMAFGNSANVELVTQFLLNCCSSLSKKLSILKKALLKAITCCKVIDTCCYKLLKNILGLFCV